MTRSTFVRTMILAGAAVGSVFPLAGASPMTSPAELEKSPDRPDAAFALDLYAKFRAKPGNLAFSPFSIATALGMTMAGAKGETLDEMGKVLHRPGMDSETQEALGRQVQAINAAGLTGDVKLTTANALFGQTGEPFSRGFVEFVVRTYGALLEPLDFARNPDEARRHINEWVASKTAGKIKDLLSPNDVTASTSLALVNAVYFKADWERPFDALATSPAPFHLDDGKSVQVPTMRRTGGFDFAEVDGLKILRLPYKGNAQAMYLLLPAANDGLAKLEASLTPETVEAWLAKPKSEHVEVALPKFRGESKSELSRPLTELGMPTAFTSRADFTGIRPDGRFFLSAVVHQAFVDVDEKGTEAAAATAVIGVRSAMPIKSKEFKADHPFLFLIRDDKSGAWLFLGRVTNPKG